MNDRLGHVNTPLFLLLLTLYSVAFIFMCAYFVQLLDFIVLSEFGLSAFVPNLVGKSLLNVFHLGKEKVMKDYHFWWRP